METSGLPKFQHLDLDMVIAAGPTGLMAFSYDAEILEFLQRCYNTLYVALAASAVAVPFALGMQWLNVKEVAQDDSADADSSDEKRWVAK
jgi:ABC-type Fe3+ transport system permease subunit